MSKKTASGNKHSILKYIMMLPAFFSLATNFVSLVKSEIHQMRQKMVYLVLLAACAVMFASSLWICLNALLVIYLISLNLSMVMAITLIAILNFMLLIITYLLILIVKKNFAFPETKEFLRNIF